MRCLLDRLTYSSTAKKEVVCVNTIRRVKSICLTEHSNEPVIFLVKIQNNLKDSALLQLVRRLLNVSGTEKLMVFT